MESAFSFDFAAMRVHAGTAAHDAASALAARAMTGGTGILFRTGEHQPGSPGGDRLLARELADVVQQAHGLPQGIPGTEQHRTTDRTAAAAAPRLPAAARRSAVANVVRGPGEPLAAPLRQEMEARLGWDFSGVRVHTDSAARASAAGVGARAYTVGGHVVIGHGGADKHTLAHELTHVIQQSQGPVAGTGHGSGLKVSAPSGRDERAAEANAARAMRTPLSQHPLTAAGTGERRSPAVPPAAGSQQTIQRALDHNNVNKHPYHYQQGQGKRAEASAMLNDGDPNIKGSAPSKDASGDPPGYGYIRSLNMTKTWIRFHLVNEEAGGKGIAANLVPASKSDNSRYEAAFEADLKDDVEDIRNGTRPGNSVYYGVEVTYQAHLPAAPQPSAAQTAAAPFFPASLAVYHEYYDSQATPAKWKWRKNAGTVFTFNDPQPHDPRQPLAISHLTLPILKQYTGLAPASPVWTQDDVGFLVDIAAAGGNRHQEFLGYLNNTTADGYRDAFDKMPFAVRITSHPRGASKKSVISFGGRERGDAGEEALEALCYSFASGVLTL